MAGVGITVVALDSLRGKLPSFDDVVHAAGEVRLPWLLAAGAAVLVSVNLFARLQERLLKAYGVAVPHCRMVALTYSRSAITFTLPGGSVLSTAYAYREYRRYGADQRTAATVLLLAGVVSAAALAALAASGMAFGAFLGERPVAPSTSTVSPGHSPAVVSSGIQAGCPEMPATNTVAGSTPFGRSRTSAGSTSVVSENEPDVRWLYTARPSSTATASFPSTFGIGSAVPSCPSAIATSTGFTPAASTGHATSPSCALGSPCSSTAGVVP